MTLLGDHLLFDCRMPATAQVVPVRARKAVPVACTHRLKAAVRHIVSADAPVVMRFKWSTERLDRPLRAHAGRLWQPCAAYVDDKLFSPVDPIHLANMFMGRLVSKRNVICVPAEDIELRLEGIRRIVDDGLETAEAELAGITDRLLFVDDELHEAIGPPCLVTTFLVRAGEGPCLSHRMAATPLKGLPEEPNFGPYGVAHGIQADETVKAYVDEMIRITGATSTSLPEVQVERETPELGVDEAILLSRSIRHLIASFGNECDVMGLDDRQFEAWLSVRRARDARDDAGQIRAFCALVHQGEHDSRRLMAMAAAGTAMRARILMSPAADPEILAAAAGLDLFEWSTS